jgi:hypothetical protein
MSEPSNSTSTAQKLAYPKDARVLTLNDHDFGMLSRDLRPGTTEIYCGSALSRTELLRRARDTRQRGATFRSFASEHARTLTPNEGIELVGYRKLRDAMRAAGSQGEWN